MSDITLRLAEACERAAGDCRHNADCDFVLTLASAPCDCGVSARRRQLRDLAAALRGAEREDPGNDPDVWSITLGDA